MSRVVSTWLVLGIASAHAVGATIDFTPPTRTVDFGTGVSETTFQVSVADSELFEQITSIRLILGSNDLQVISFDFEPEFSDHFDSVFRDTMGTEAYASGINLEAINFTFQGTPVLDLPALVGTLTVDAAGLAPGDYMVEVNATTDGGRSVIANAAAGASTENLFGNGTVTVVRVTSTDSDGDGVNDTNDAFPDDPTETTDTDSDGTGDNSDAFPNDASETTDSDDDGTGDNADAFPNDPDETADTDADGTGDNADPDDDNDGVDDVDDAFPLDPTETADSDGDGVGDNADAGGANANTGPRATGGFCGAGMLGTGFFMLLGLASLRFRRARFVLAVSPF